MHNNREAEQWRKHDAVLEEQRGVQAEIIKLTPKHRRKDDLVSSVYLLVMLLGFGSVAWFVARAHGWA